MFNDTVTIYNKYVQDGTEKWQRTILVGVFWNDIKGAVARKTGLTPTDSLQLLIPFSVSAGGVYKAPKAWGTLASKSGYWTIQDGDTVIKGSITYDVTKSSKELHTYDDVRTITSIDTKSFGGNMSHWEVSGK